jgi:hypothetical protein
LALRKDVQRVVEADDLKFLKIISCYWYNDPDDQEETGKKIGTYEHLGKSVYENFTGEVFIRCDTIINISYLKSGPEGEPKNL